MPLRARACLTRSASNCRGLLADVFGLVCLRGRTDFRELHAPGFLNVSVKMRYLANRSDSVLSGYMAIRSIMHQELTAPQVENEPNCGEMAHHWDKEKHYDTCFSIDLIVQNALSC